MKVKNTLLLQTIGMYVMHLPLYVMLITINMSMNEAVEEKLTSAMLIATLVLMAIMVPICILNVIVSLVSSIKQDVDPTKTTMVMKLCLIPWYILNFVIGFVFVSIFFNPFMMIAIPVIVALLASSTYILMLSTSIADIAYFIHKIKRDHGFTPTTTIAVLFMFIFCLDVLGSMILYKKSQKLSCKAQEITPAE